MFLITIFGRIVKKKRITGMNPKASFENQFENSLLGTYTELMKIGVSRTTGMLPSALRDCSTNQFRCAMLSELEFHE